MIQEVFDIEDTYMIKFDSIKMGIALGEIMNFKISSVSFYGVIYRHE